MAPLRSKSRTRSVAEHSRSVSAPSTHRFERDEGDNTFDGDESADEGEDTLAPASKHAVGTALRKSGAPRRPYGSVAVDGGQRALRSPRVALPSCVANCDTSRVLEALGRTCCHDGHLSNLTLHQLTDMRRMWAQLGSRKEQKKWMVTHLQGCTRRRQTHGGVEDTYFEYRLPIPAAGNPVVCEKAFLVAFGENQHGFSENMLSQVRHFIANGEPLQMARATVPRKAKQTTRVVIWLSEYVANCDRVGESNAGEALWHMHEYLVWKSLYEAFVAAFVRAEGSDTEAPSYKLFSSVRRNRFAGLHRPHRGTYGRCTKCTTLWRQAEEAFRASQPEVSSARALGNAISGFRT